MNRNAIKRIQKELRDFDPGDTFGIEPVDSNLLDLKAFIMGPDDTPYKGGKFYLEVKIPDRYPFIPPDIKFITRIWHPNISSATGVICLDVLKENWVAASSVRTALISVQLLLATPEPDNPQDAVVATQLKNNIRDYQLTARYWTYSFAMSPGEKLLKKKEFEEFDQKIDKLVQICGVSRNKALETLSMHSWQMNKASMHIF